MTEGILLNALKNIRDGKVPYTAVCEYAGSAIRKYEVAKEEDPIRTFVNKKLKKDLTSTKL
jgi:hypothetical protein